eukprot:TRINITY_DN24805_c0_g1_i1.p1 TRINITY_DN24805_c0_g1~~TRINITY_DN24805_c0_g1_i1.p1  ORF type:complete len:936 (-),score=165.71 TRINITY_DN24805_c0_g1_i1:83-2890(-)
MAGRHIANNCSTDGSAVRQGATASATMAGGRIAPKVHPTSPRFWVEYFRHALENLKRILLRSGSSEIDAKEFFRVCVILAKCLDIAVAYNLIPASLNDLPHLVKQVHKRRDDEKLQPAIMVLMLSVKNACVNGWFLTADKNELLPMVKETMNCFTNVGEDKVPESSTAFPIISHVISRYYPRLKLNSIVLSFEAKAGYDCHVVDVRMSRKPAAEKMCLFVARIDNLETSACLITPPQVSFVINGKGVDKRCIISMDTGPQMPTDISNLLKLGINLLQAVGDFNGHYLIAVISMSECPSALPASKLPDYVAPPISVSGIDDEIIEGPSKISLNCPISYQRIVIPVKGSLCRHHQCFDYENFMEINSRRPSWRCPYCNGHLTSQDLRIDQMMLKVLKEVDESISDILIHKDGSWKAVTRDDDTINHSDMGNLVNSSGAMLNNAGRGNESHEIHIVDLTNETSEGILDGFEKPSMTQQCGSLYSLQQQNQDVGNTTESKPDIEMLRRASITSTLSIFSAVCPITQSNSRFNVQAAAEASARDRCQVSVPASMNTLVMPMQEPRYIARASDTFSAPILTDAVSCSLNQTPMDTQNLSEATNSLQTMASAIMPSLVGCPVYQIQSIRENPPLSAEYDRHCSRMVSRVPIAVQALPAQTQVANVFPRTSSFQPNCSSPFPFHSDIERQHLVSQHHQNLRSYPEVSTVAPLQMQSQGQNQFSNHAFLSTMNMQNPTQRGMRNSQEVQCRPTVRTSFQLSQEQQNSPASDWRPPIPAQSQQIGHQLAQLSPSVGQMAVVSEASNLPSYMTNRQPHVPQCAFLNVRPCSSQYSVPLAATIPSSQRLGNIQNIDKSRQGNMDQRRQLGSMSMSHTQGLEQAWRPTGRMRGSIAPGRVGSTAANLYLSQQRFPTNSGPPYLPAFTSSACNQNTEQGLNQQGSVDPS